MDAGQRAMVAEAALDAEKLEFAQILDVITNVDLDLAMDYKTIEAGAYVIQPGAPMDVDDVKFECPDGVLPCVVLVIETTENDERWSPQLSCLLEARRQVEILWQ